MCRVTKLMAYAVNEAHKSQEPNKHGCVVARGSRVMARGFNKSKTHPAAKHSFSKHLHAELSAIVGVSESDLVGSDLFVCRIYRKTSQRTMSKPCLHCMKLIRSAGIRRIFFTQEDGTTKIEKV